MDHLFEFHNVLIWSFFVGICVALLFAYYVKHVVGGIVRYLLENGCRSEETAKELPGTNAFDGLLRKLALRNGSGLYQTVGVFDGNKYYIFGDEAEKARKKYKGDIKPVHVIVAIIALFVFAFIIWFFFDTVSAFFGDMFNSVEEGFKSIGGGGEQ